MSPLTSSTLDPLSSGRSKIFRREVDDAGRFLVPPDLLDEYGDGVIFNMGFGVYLHFQNDAAWWEFKSAFARAHILDEDTADIAVRFITTQFRQTTDTLGRVEIPAKLRELASIQRGIVGVPVQLTTVAYFRIYASELYEPPLTD